MTLFSRFSVLTRYVMVCVLLSMSVIALSAPPRWLRYLPKAGNDTYRYVVESATATSEDAAYKIGRAHV